MSRHVVFNENEFSFKENFLTTSLTKQETHKTIVSCLSFPNLQHESCKNRSPGSSSHNNPSELDTRSPSDKRPSFESLSPAAEQPLETFSQPNEISSFK